MISLDLAYVIWEGRTTTRFLFKGGSEEGQKWGVWGSKIG
jgi:hypothetical protein